MCPTNQGALIINIASAVCVQTGAMCGRHALFGKAGSCTVDVGLLDESGFYGQQCQTPRATLGTSRRAIDFIFDDVPGTRCAP